jgi:hypothetical protein
MEREEGRECILDGFTLGLVGETSSLASLFGPWEMRDGDDEERIAVEQ